MPKPRGTPLARRFYSTGPESLAVSLLGKLLVRVLSDGERLSGIIVETEAYVGVIDRASHAFGGRRTPRNESMYARPGTAYVYFTYGMHHCVNVVCGRAGDPLAVLIRALEPVEGLERMRTLRGSSTRPGRRHKDTDLCSGPGKLCQALAIDRDLDGTDLAAADTLFIERGPRGMPRDTACTPRIGLGQAGEWASKRLRWLVESNPHVSVPVPRRTASHRKRPIGSA